MINCPICNSAAQLFTLKKDRLNQEYQYFRCQNCKFLFDKDLVLNKKKLEKKVNKTYQKDYFKEIDKGWKIRGDKISQKINRFLKIYKFLRTGKKEIKVLDYGGGNGYITSKISNGFDVFYYDRYAKPIYNGNYKILEKPLKVDIVYGVELVEHFTDIEEWDFLFDKLSANVLLFTTELSDEISSQQLIKWWYLNPDAGHTCVYSLESLCLLAKKYGFLYFFFPSKSFHIFFRSPFLSRFCWAKLEFPIYNFFRKIKHILRT